MIRFFTIFKDSYKKIGSGGTRITKINAIITIILIITRRQRESKLYPLVFNIVAIFLQFSCVSWITGIVIGRGRRLGKGYGVRSSFFGLGFLAQDFISKLDKR